MTEVLLWEFAPFLLDAANVCLWCNGTLVDLPPKAFAVLCYLVEHHGRLVTKNHLLQVIWENRVDEGALKAQIAFLRKALKDDPRRPRYVDTVAGYGYRFIAPVKTAVKPQLVSIDIRGSARSLSEQVECAIANAEPGICPLSTAHTQIEDVGMCPDLRGEWEIAVEFNGRSYIERLRVVNQKGRHFSGILITPHPLEGNKPIEQILRGEFADKFHAFYTYHSMSKAFTESGTGIFVIEMDHQIITGKSINFGISAKEPTLAMFKAQKLSADVDECQSDLDAASFNSLLLFSPLHN